MDISQPRIDAWNSDKLPIYEPRLDEVVFTARCVAGSAASRHMPGGRGAAARRALRVVCRRCRHATVLLRAARRLRPRTHAGADAHAPRQCPSAGCSGRNLFFSTDVKKHIAEADVVFVRRVPTWRRVCTAAARHPAPLRPVHSRCLSAGTLG